MSREEEITKAAEKFAFSHKTETPNIYDAINDFYYGAKWADKHPKRYNQDELCDIQLEMMKQRDERLIKKVCEWLEDTDFDMEYWNSEEGFCKREFIEEFRKAMEE